MVPTCSGEIVVRKGFRWVVPVGVAMTATLVACANTGVLTGAPEAPRMAPVAWLSESAPSSDASPTEAPQPTSSEAAESQADQSGTEESTASESSAGPSSTGWTVSGQGARPSGAGERQAIRARAETALMPGAQGDVADDVAIWRNPEHPEQSLIVGDNKSDSGGGLAVYRLDGTLVHYEPAGKIGNVDLRMAGVGDRAVVLVGANDRDSNGLRFWSLDPQTGGLTSLEARALPAGQATYGFCLGRDPTMRHTYAFVTSRDSGVVEQYELWAHDGKVDAVLMRSFDVGSVSEACVVDDATGALYVAEEQVGVWRYEVDPQTGDRRSAVDRVGAGHLAADVEGVAVVRGAQGRGYLLVSSQGDSTFAVYDADGDHAYRGGFTVGGGDSPVDGASVTDGLEAVPGDLGPSFPHGLLVVHDAENQAAGGGAEPASNLKLVRLDDAVQLDDSGDDRRSAGSSGTRTPGA